MQKLKKRYKSPDVVIIRVLVEKGYSGSGNKEDGGIDAPGWG